MKNTFVERAFNALNVKYFEKAALPDKAFDYELNCPLDRQYILRMMIKQPHQEFNIPPELKWCEDLIMKSHQMQLDNNIKHSYCYITVRHGIHDAVTEDIWHTDGYSEIITHIPEQNYIVTSDYCTEYVEIPLTFPKSFDALKHNIVEYIDNKVTELQPKIHVAKANVVYVFDPYVIHRRPVEAFGKQRTFVRVTFVPIEVCDDACYINPNIEKKTYNRNADTTRNKLTSFEE